MKLSPKQLSISVITVAVIVLLFLLHYLRVLRPVENIVIRLLQPLQRVTYQASDQISDWYQDRRTNQQLHDENDQLKNEMAALVIEKARILLLEEENQFLRGQLVFQDDDSVTGVIASVVAKSGDETNNTIIINQGNKSGLKPGLAVVAADRVIVGTVISVTDYTSMVLLLNDHNSQVAGSVLNGDRTIGVVRGEYGLGVKMELIPQTEEIAEEDIVVTSGVEALIPRGLVIGTMDTVILHEESLFQQAVLRVPLNYNKLFIVTVLVPNENVADGI